MKKSIFIKDTNDYIKIKWLDLKFILKKFIFVYGTTGRKFTEYTEAELKEIGLDGIVLKTQK